MHHPAPLPSSLTALDRTLVMGVVNVTPDSFSDGGRWFDTGAAVAHGLELLAQGADILDVGGESTRPGALLVPVDEERRRVLPVVAELVAAGAVVSVDTMRPGVAAAAVSALCAAARAWCVRVHDVPGSVDAVRVGAAWLAARDAAPAAKDGGDSA